MIWKAKIFCFFIFIFSQLSFGQSDSVKNIENLLGSIINDSQIEQENSPLYDLIEQYIENPINLNNSSELEIMNLPFLDIQSANAIIKYRLDNGIIFSFSELKLDSNISPRTIKVLQAFTFLDKRSQEKNISFFEKWNFKLRTRVSQNIQKTLGYETGYYEGPPIKVYNRLKLDASSKVKVGLLMEKDAGEKSYFDFYSFYFQAKNLVTGFNILVGYYTMEFGQGLAMWSPYSFSKSSNATNSIIKRARGISPYSSAGEYLYMKGGAINYSNTYFKVSSFYSTENDDYFNISKNIVGVSASVFPIDIIKISALYFQRNVNPADEEITDQPNNKQKHLSISYEVNYNNLFLVGEFATYKKSVASINTLQLSLLKSFLIVASIRNYPSNYQSYYAQGFGETKRTSNEFGIYLGFKWRTNFGIFNFYLDQFKYPNSTSAIALPSSGNELSFSYEVSPLPKSQIYFRYFSENKEVIELVETEFNIVNRKTEKFRFELLYKVSKSIQLKTRVELLLLDQVQRDENGILLFQDVKFNFNKTLTIYSRIIFFQTDSFASRIYEFENDLTGVMTNPALWGSGVKWYLIFRYSPLNNFYISAKYSELYKPNESFLGSGNNLIEGNVDNRVAIQVDFAF